MPVTADSTTHTADSTLWTADGWVAATGVTADSGTRRADEICWTADGYDGCAIAANEEPPSGGWVPRHSRRREDDDEELADRLEMTLAEDGLIEPDPVVAARHAVREYAAAAYAPSKRTERAVEYALRARTEFAWQLAARQIEREIADEDAAILTLLALVA